jgi:hypothetical protein
VPQPDPQPDHPDRVDIDPLLAFNAEPGEPEPPETPVDPAPVAASPSPDDVPSLKQRLDQAERSLDRAFTDIGVLKSDLATLVATIDDIRKRQSRPPEPVAVPPREFVAPPPPVVRKPRASLATTAAVAILFFVLAATFWGVRAFLTGEEQETVSGEVGVASATPQSSLPNPNSITPQSQLPTPDSIVPVGATIEPPPVPPVRVVGERPAPAIGYVGTLSIDASPPGDVFIDRKPAGRTPVRIERLRAGSHLVWIERDGYRRFTRVVPVTADRVSRVSARLDPLSP